MFHALNATLMLSTVQSRVSANNRKYLLFDERESTQMTAKTGNRLVGELWLILGVDPNTTPDGLTLGEIGLESLFAIQLQREFKDKLDINVPLAHIKGLTVGMFRSYGEDNPEPIREYLIARKSGHSSILRNQFVMPTEKYLRLNEVTGGGRRAPVFFMPPLTMSFAAFGDLCRRLDRPAIGLNWTRETSQLTSVNSLAEHYRTLMETLSGGGRYDIVGYLDTIPVCVEIMMRAAGGGGAGKVVVVDANAADEHLFNDQICDNLMIEFMLKQLSIDAPTALMDCILSRVRAEPQLKAKLAVIMAHMPELTHKQLVAPDMEKVLGIMLARIRTLFENKHRKRRNISQTLRASVAAKWAKISGKLIIIKPSHAGCLPNMDDTVELALGLNAPESQQYATTGTISVENVEQSGSMATITKIILAKIYNAIK
ncbi:unnamed protein product, partial [Medioppia subpectinata]